jgi:hypothetical protein
MSQLNHPEKLQNSATTEGLHGDFENTLEL